MPRPRSGNIRHFLPACPGASTQRMVKADLVNKAAKAAGVTKTQAAVAIEALFDSIKESLLRGERIELRGFGVFEVKAKKTGIGRNPKTGDEMPIPAGKAIRFKPGKEIRIL